MKMSITTTLAWACLLCFSQQTFASETNDVSPQLSTDKINEILIGVPDHNWSFRKWFEYSLDENGRENYEQRFGPLSKFTWVQIAVVFDNHAVSERAQSKGEAYFLDTIGESILGGFNSWFDFDRFKEVCSPALTFGAKFAEGSLDPREGRLRPDSVEPGNVASIHNWVSTFFRDDQTRYGLKLFSNKPYIYYSRAFWENDQGKPLVIIDTRVRLTTSSSHAKRLRIDEHLLIPIDDKTQLSIGCRLYPNGFGPEESRPLFTFRLSHQLNSRVDYDDIIYFSAQFNDVDQIFLFGFSLSKVIEMNH